MIETAAWIFLPQAAIDPTPRSSCADMSRGHDVKETSQPEIVNTLVKDRTIVRKLMLSAVMAISLVLSFNTHRASAQPGKRELGEDVNDLTQLDPDIEKYLPRWKILEADLKIKLAQYFRLSGLPVSETDSMVVTATFVTPGTGAQELLSIRVGDDPNAHLSGTAKIRSELGDALYNRILNRDYALSPIEPATPVTTSARTRIPNVLQPTNVKQFIAVSAFRQTVQLGTTGARLDNMLGNDEIGYQFWSSGQGKVILSYPIIPLDDPDLRSKGVPDILTIGLGGAYRLKVGSPDENFLDGAIQPRRLNGAIGGKAIAHIEYRLPQLNDLGFLLNAEVPFSKLQGADKVDLSDGVVTFPERSGRTDTVQAGYFLRNVAQGVLFWETWLNDYEHFFRVSVGASYQEVARGVAAAGLKPVTTTNHLFPDGVLYQGLYHPTTFQDWIFAKVEYLNQSGFPFGISAQISNQNLLIDGFIPLFPNWLFIEAKYSTPVLRDNPQPWESNSFFMISPILRFVIDNTSGS